MRNLKHRILVTLGVILAITVYFALAWWFFHGRQPEKEYIELSSERKQYLNKRFKFHGISGCVEDKNGYYFVRDGKRCRL